VIISPPSAFDPAAAIRDGRDRAALAARAWSLSDTRWDDGTVAAAAPTLPGS